MTELFQKILKKLSPSLSTARHYLAFIVFLIFLLIYFGLVLRINQLDASNPTDMQITGQLKSVQTPKIDPATLTKIQQLKDQNVQVQTLFDQARNNPFSE